MNRYVIVLILFLISCTSISNYIAVATSKRGAKKSQKWAKESVEVMEQMQQLIEEMQKSLLNELDTTIHHSDNLTKKIKENSDKFVNKLYDEINNGLLSFINPESFIVEVKLSVEHTKWYDSTFISMEYELDEDENITFKVNNKGNFDFGATKDELIKSFNQEGLIQNEWYFLDEKLILFIAVKPEINIHIDKTLEINMYKTPLSLLINEILNCTNTGSCVQSIRFDEFEGRINFISTDMSKIMKQEVKPKTMVLSKEDVYDESWAVIIGIDKYQYSDQLNYAVKDAKAVKNMLINKFNYPEENIRYLVDEEATLSNIKLNLGEVATSAEENDRILIFYSGHGETLIGADNSEKGYIIPFEGKQDNPYATGIAMDEILTTSQMSKSRHMLFLMDACYSGLMTEHVKGLSKPKGDGYLSKVANEKARQIITAGGNEPAIEGGRWNHSVFTKNLLEGLDDWAADTDSDGYITADELGTYLRKSVTEDSNNQQTPQKGRFINSGGGEFVFFSEIKASTTLEEPSLNKLIKLIGEEAVKELLLEEMKSKMAQVYY